MYKYYINLDEAIIRNQKLRLTYKDLSTVAPLCHIQITENY